MEHKSFLVVEFDLGGVAVIPDFWADRNSNPVTCLWPGDKLASNLAKKRASTSDSWETYPLTIISSCDTFGDAYKLMKKSLKESDVVSSSNECKNTRAKRKRRRNDSLSTVLRILQESESEGELQPIPQFSTTTPSSKVSTERNCAVSEKILENTRNGNKSIFNNNEAQSVHLQSTDDYSLVSEKSPNTAGIVSLRSSSTENTVFPKSFYGDQTSSRSKSPQNGHNTNFSKSSHNDSTNNLTKSSHNDSTNNLTKSSHNDSTNNLTKSSHNDSTNNLTKSSHNDSTNNLTKSSHNDSTNHLTKSSHNVCNSNLTKSIESSLVSSQSQLSDTSRIELLSKSPVTGRTLLSSKSPATGKTLLSSKSPATAGQALLSSKSLATGKTLLSSKSPLTGQTFLLLKSPVTGKTLLSSKSPATGQTAISSNSIKDLHNTILSKSPNDPNNTVLSKSTNDTNIGVPSKSLDVSHNVSSKVTDACEINEVDIPCLNFDALSDLSDNDSIDFSVQPRKSITNGPVLKSNVPISNSAARAIPEVLKPPSMTLVKESWYKDVIRNQEIMKASLRNVVEMMEIVISNNRLPNLANAEPASLKSHERDYGFPLYTLENLQALETELENEDNRKNLQAYLGQFGGVNLGDVVKRILRHVFAEELGSKFSWEGKKGKEKLSSLRLMDILFSCVKRANCVRETTNVDIEKIIKDWFRHAPARLRAKNNSD